MVARSAARDGIPSVARRIADLVARPIER